jgi:hypothetical protein
MRAHSLGSKEIAHRVALDLRTRRDRGAFARLPRIARGIARALSART